MANKPSQHGKSQSVPKPRTSYWRSTGFQITLLLSVVTFVVFGNALKNGYTYDDKPFIANNYIVQQGIPAIPTLLTTNFWAGYTNANQVNPSYRPLPLITLAIEYQFWGKNPRVNHFFNVLLYGLTSVLLYFLLQLLFGERYPGLALITTLLFCVHPIHTEVVANIKGRDDLLALFNGLAALYLTLRFVQRPKALYLIAASAFYLLHCYPKSILSPGWPSFP